MQILFFLTLFVSPIVFAAPQPTALQPTAQIEIQKTLRLPTEMRVRGFQEMGQQGFDGLTKVAFDPAQKLENRWRAVTALGRAYPRLSRKSLEKAMTSNEWFMRNAATLVLKYGERNWAVGWARILMHDQALVVRSAAVDVLKELGATEAKPLLWEKLYSSENFKGGQSLWVRHQIAEALVDMTPQKNDPGSIRGFYKLLNDSDSRLRNIGVTGLQKVTAQKLNTQKEWADWIAQNDSNKKRL